MGKRYIQQFAEVSEVPKAYVYCSVSAAALRLVPR
jgi:hypothetical protein